MLLEVFFFCFFDKKARKSLLNIENQITTLRGVSKRVPLHESGLPQKFPQGKLLIIDQMC